MYTVHVQLHTLTVETHLMYFKYGDVPSTPFPTKACKPMYGI